MQKNNCFFFSPENGTVKPGILSKEVWDPSIREMVKSISLVKLRQSESKGGKKYFEVPGDWASSKVILGIPQMPPKTEGRVIIGGHVESQTTETGGRRHYLSTPRKGSGIIVQIDTGLYGDAFAAARLLALMPKSSDGTPLMHPHGSYDRARSGTAGGVEHVAGTGRNPDAVPRAYHVAWQMDGKPVLVPSSKGEVKVFLRRKDLWVLREGSPGLVVHGSTPDSLYRLVNENGAAVAKPPADDAERRRLQEEFDEQTWEAWQRAELKRAQRAALKAN
jgi:hypothetical protein